MTETAETLDIQVPKVERYFYWSSILMLTFVGLALWGVGVVVALIYALTFGKWLSRKQAQVLEYRLHPTHLYVNNGVFFISQKTIPLDRITDIVLRQGPLLRHFGLWRLDIQTAGVGQQRAEARLHGLMDTEQTKNQILNARDSVAIQNKQNPGF